MQAYNSHAAGLIGFAVASLRRLDWLTERETAHRLDKLEPLIVRLEAIRADLAADRLAAATRKTHDLTLRLVGGLLELENPAYRSALASALAQYREKPKPKHSRLGALRGGRPRKDGTPRRTLESKGYSAETLPPPKVAGVRVHPKRGAPRAGDADQGRDDPRPASEIPRAG